MNPTSSSNSASEDSDVACYVLAYLLHENYSQTANTFLKECRVLPTGTLLVLPQTSLKSVVSDHKSRHESNVLLKTLGSSSTYQALWTKLNKTLQQMKCLYEQLLSCQPTSAQQRTGIRSKTISRVKQTRQVTTSAAMATTAPQPKPSTSGSGIATPTDQVATPTYQQAVMTTSIHSPQKTLSPPILSSPHRRKPVPKRKTQPSDVESVGVAGTSYASPSSPTMHQILETFLEDDYLPGKLADIINKCVDSDSSNSELSTTTLDSILNLTQSEPAFEGLLQGAPPPSLSTSEGHPPPSLSTSEGHQTTAGQLQTVSTSENITNTYSESSATSVGGEESQLLAPPPKRARMDADLEGAGREFPSEKDIDDFLDQLHH